MKNKVLIADDEEEILDLISTALDMKGYEVFTALNGAEAIQLLKENAIHFCLLDLQMPVMNGMEACREIRKTKPVSIIYAMTGKSSLYDLVECRDAGFDDYFVKPVKLSELVSEIDLAFNKINRWMKRSQN